MVKRRANDLKSPKDGKIKIEKRDSSPESDQEEEDFEEETFTDADETKAGISGQSTYEPDQLRILVESFVEFFNIRQSQNCTVFNMEKLVAEWAETRPEDCIDVSLFCADYRKYLKTALRVKLFQLNDASSALLTYLGSEKSLPEFNGFPAKPPTKIHLYIKKKELSHTPKGMGEAYKAMREDGSGVIDEVNEEIRAASAKLVPNLHDFINAHPNLTAIQKEAVEKRIKSVQKQFKTKEPAAPRTPRKKSKKEPETAYSLWCRTKTDKYRDLSEEEREKKLQKKFAKITDAERQLLESLVLTQ
uniref:Uncharacterized protein n=1 Tax=Caenorhabditis japonica TaxID=281687 RepID=A0A8R1I8V0_CAEJA